MQETLSKVKQVITEEVERSGGRVKQVLLFGSRATGTSRPGSDWDFYVIIEPNLELRLREAIASRIRFRLAQENVFADVFVQSAEVVNQRKGDTGYMTYYVLKEGVPI